MAKPKVIRVPSGDSTTPPSKDGPRVIMGHESEIDEIAELQIAMERSQRRIDEIRAKLDPLADAERCKIEAETGRSCKLIQVKGNTVNGRYTFADRYSLVDLGNVPDLRKLLGVHFDTLFRTTETIALKRDAAPRLLSLLRMQNHADEFLSVDPGVTPVGDFRATRASLRGSMSAAANDALDKVVSQVATRPSLSVK